MFYSSIKQIELEITTRCNAACPQCVRNYYGGKTWESLPLVDLDLKITCERLLPLLENQPHIKFCGTYGDPCVRKDLIDWVQWIRDNSDSPITINTNGGLQSPSWWKKLAKVLGPNDKVFWGIDGLEDTNHLHRRNVVWKNLQRNLEAFNQAGGRSIWSYIVFEHNQDQVEQAKTFSEQLGCENFAVKKTSRFIDKRHQLVDKTPVMNNHGQQIYWLRPPTNKEYLNPGYDLIKSTLDANPDYEEYLKTNLITCMVQQMNFCIITAEGYVLPCGWLYDRFYGYEPELHRDHAELFSMIERTGGLQALSLYNHPIEDILNGKFFSELEQSWATKNRLQRCAHQCGTATNLFKNVHKDFTGMLNGPIYS
jgi:MoaA/NifB/PqqE/SkfB family radical SAM enzyme